MSDRINFKALVEKWSPVIDTEYCPKVTGRGQRETLAVLLENTNKDAKKVSQDRTQRSLTEMLSEQIGADDKAELIQEAAPTNAMGASSTTTGPFKIYDPILMGVMRRSIPNQLPYEILGVQPMTGPTGQVFFKKTHYSSTTGKEALFNVANTTHSASYAGNTASQTAQTTAMDPSLLVTGSNTSLTVSGALTTALGEALGGAAGDHFNEMAISMGKITVTAKERGLKAEWSHELATDMENVHGLNVESELARDMSLEISNEINREIVAKLYITATHGAQENVTTAGVFDMNVNSGGRHLSERFHGLAYQIGRDAGAIARSTRVGKGNFIVTSYDVAEGLDLAGKLGYAENANLNADDTGNLFVGTMRGMKVYIDPYFASSAGNHFVLVGLKGQGFGEQGMFYCPYVPLTMHRAIGENTFQPKMAFKTRYGLVSNPFATNSETGIVHVSHKNKYYRLFVVSNLM